MNFPKTRREGRYFICTVRSGTVNGMGGAEEQRWGGGARRRRIVEVVYS